MPKDSTPISADSLRIKLRYPNIIASVTGVAFAGLVISPLVAVGATGGDLVAVVQLVGVTLIVIVGMAVLAGVIRPGSIGERLARAGVLAVAAAAILGPVVVAIAGFRELADWWAVGVAATFGLLPAIGYATARWGVRAVRGPIEIVLGPAGLELGDRTIQWSDLESVRSHAAMARRQTAVSVQHVDGQRTVVGSTFEATQAREVVRLIRERLGRA